MFINAKRWAAAGALSLLAAASVLAADASGKWTWTTKFNDREITTKAEFKQEGEKLTGTITGRDDQKIEIKEGKIKDNEVSFVVVRERNGSEFKITYKGKLEGDTIKGKSTVKIDGQDRERDWEAKRAK
jgi:hypothetical protein